MSSRILLFSAGIAIIAACDTAPRSAATFPDSPTNPNAAETPTAAPLKGGVTAPATGTPGNSTTQAAFYYTCVMHPAIHLDHPGNCPICGMALVKKNATP